MKNKTIGKLRGMRQRGLCLRIREGFLLEVRVRHTLSHHRRHPSYCFHSEIVRMPKVTPHSPCTRLWFQGPPHLDCSVCFLSLSNLSGLNSLPIPLQHMIPAHDGREMDGTTRLLKKTQKMGQLEPLIIVGLQLQFDIKPHLLMIGSFSVHFK